MSLWDFLDRNAAGLLYLVLVILVVALAGVGSGHVTFNGCGLHLGGTAALDGGAP